MVIPTSTGSPLCFWIDQAPTLWTMGPSSLSGPYGLGEATLRGGRVRASWDKVLLTGQEDASAAGT